MDFCSAKSPTVLIPAIAGIEEGMYVERSFSLKTMRRERFVALPGIVPYTFSGTETRDDPYADNGP